MGYMDLYFYFLNTTYFLQYLTSIAEINDAIVRAMSAIKRQMCTRQFPY